MYIYNILIGKPGGKRLVGRPKHRWMNTRNIKMDVTDLKDIRCEAIGWIRVTQDRVQWRGLL
jgi:hypothetical protein